MRNTTASDAAIDARQRVDRGLEALRAGLGPYVERHLRDRHGYRWRDHVSRARGDEAEGELDVYALLKTLLDNWNDLFRHDSQLHRARSFISLAMDARNRSAHFTGELSTREALRYLDAMCELAAAAGTIAQAEIIEKIYVEQAQASSLQAVPPPVPAVNPNPAADRQRAWQVCPAVPSSHRDGRLPMAHFVRRDRDHSWVRSTGLRPAAPGLVGKPGIRP